MADRTKQGGSVISRAIISIALILGLVGAIYAVQQFSENARKERANVAFEDQTDKKTETKTETKDSTTKTDTKAESSQSTDNSTVTELPQTGASIDVLKTSELAIFAMILAAYFGSRKNKVSIFDL